MPEYAPIQNIHSVDLIGARHDGGVDLMIVASAKLDGTVAIIRSLMAKVGTYLSYINSPEFEHEFGKPSSERVEIVLSMSEAPHPLIEDAAKHIEPWVRSSNATFRMEMKPKTLDVDKTRTMVTTSQTKMTADELFDLPLDDFRRELLNGELKILPPASSEHELRTNRVTRCLSDFIEKNHLGVGCGLDTGFIISRDPDTVRRADFAFVSRDRIPSSGMSNKCLPLAADLAVEVLSTLDFASDFLEKIDEWLAAGTRMVWVVDPDRRTITTYGPSRPPQTFRLNDQLGGDDFLPGLQLPVAEIFR